MDITLKIDGSVGKVVIQLLEDRASRDESPNFICLVSANGKEYRSRVPVSEMQILLRLLQSLSISIIGNCPTGLDGTTQELSISNDMTHAKYRWWSNASSGWESINEISQAIRQIAVKHAGVYV